MNPPAAKAWNSCQPAVAGSTTGVALSIQSWNFFGGSRIQANALRRLSFPLRSNQPDSCVRASPMAMPPTGVMIMSLMETGSLYSTSSHASAAPKVHANASGMDTRFPRAKV